MHSYEADHREGVNIRLVQPSQRESGPDFYDVRREVRYGDSGSVENHASIG